MKASIANVIATTPLRLPYFDLEAYKSIEPLEARYRASVSEIDSKSAEKYGIDPEHVPEIILAQFQAGQYINQKLKEKGIGHVEAAPVSIRRHCQRPVQERGLLVRQLRCLHLSAIM